MGASLLALAKSIYYVFMPIRITRNSILKYIPFVIKAAKR